MKRNLTLPQAAAGGAATVSKSPSRRAFLGGGLLLGALAAVGGLSWFVRKPEDLGLSVLDRHLPDTTLPRRDLEGFAISFARQNKQMRKHPMAVNGLRMVGPIVFSDAFLSLIPASKAQLLEKFEREIVTTFLFSTDFFEQGARRWEGVSYVGFYDPYDRACANPLAQFAEDDSL